MKKGVIYVKKNWRIFRKELAEGISLEPKKRTKLQY